MHMSVREWSNERTVNNDSVATVSINTECQKSCIFIVSQRDKSYIFTHQPVHFFRVSESNPFTGIDQPVYY